MELKKILMKNGWKRPRKSDRINTIMFDYVNSLVFNYMGSKVFFCQDSLAIVCGTVWFQSDTHEAESMAEALWWFLSDCLEKTEKKQRDWHRVETDLRVMDTAAEVLSDCFAIRKAIDSIATAVFARAMD